MIFASRAFMAMTALCAAPAIAQPRHFDVAAQPAASGVRAFAEAAQVQILITGDTAAGRRTNAVKGQYDIDEGLRLLLQGTGLKAVSSGPASYAVLSDVQAEVTQEVVVTAQKRQESVQDVPLSLSVVSARTMEVHRLSDIRDVSRLTPGLMVSAFNYSSPTIAIRGASNTFTQIGAHKPVAVVLDDIFIPRNSAAVFDLYGLSSVQVLKGPQGTLFGRNVTGGAILLDTGKPAIGHTGGSLRVGAGNHELRQIDGLADVAVGEVGALRLAASVKSRDGYGRDRLSGQALDDQDSRSVRAQYRLDAGDGLEVLIGADYGEDETGGRTLSSKAAGSDGDRRTAEMNYPQGFRRNQWGASVRLYQDTAVGRFASITGFRQSQSGEDYSGTGVSYAFLSGTNTQSVNRDVDQVELLSQEVRYASPKWSRGDFVAGVYLSREKATRQLRTQTLRAVTGVPASDVLTDQGVKSTSYSLYADGVINLPASLFLTLGARYTHDEKIASLNRVDHLNAANTFADAGLKASWSEVTPRVVLSWVPKPGLRAYASVTRGYTAGGFNTDAATLGALRTPFDPETVTSSEIGLKSQWLDNRLRVNASVFDMQYDDKQELFFNNVTRVLTITNAAKASIEGAELEIFYRPARWLNLSATWGYLDTVYENFIIPGGAVYTGNPVASSPRHKGSLAADFRQPLGAGFVFGGLSWTATDGYYTGASKDPNLHVESYELVNGSLGYEHGAWTVMAWVRNAGDTEYVLTPSTQGVLAEYLGEPRTFGLSLSRRF